MAFGEIGYSGRKVHQTFVNALSGDPAQAVVFLSLDEGKPVGVFLGAVTETPFSDEKIGLEVAFWLLPGYRKSRRPVDLIRAFEYWAKNIAKVRYVVVAETPLTDTTKRSYQALGYTNIENSYLKKVV